MQPRHAIFPLGNDRARAARSLEHFKDYEDTFYRDMNVE
jgi:hypothetical protein